MTKYLFMFLILSSAYVPLSQAEEEGITLEMICTTELPMLGLEEANRFAFAVLELITASSYGEADADVIKTDKDIIWEEAIMVRDEYLARMKAEGVAEKSIVFGFRIQHAVTKTVLEDSQYFLILDIGIEDENWNVTPRYTLKFGLGYTFDTCYGEGYTPGPTGAVVVKRKNGTAHSLLNPFKI